MTSTIDTIRALYTYTTALVIIVGGGAIIYVSRADPSSADVVAIVAGFMGAALTFLFSSETQTRTARQTNTASNAGAIQHANGIANVAQARDYAAGMDTAERAKRAPDG